MDSIQKHWKPIAAGLVATSLAAYLVYINRSVKAHAELKDINTQKAALAANPDQWPKLRRIIDFKAPSNDQKK